MKQIRDFHAYLYVSKDKIKQDLLILACCKGQKPKRGKYNHAAVSIKYHVRLCDGEMIRVCAKPFLGITNFGKDRIQRIVRNFVVTGELPRERRGGNRVGPKNDEKRNCIKQFIESITCTVSHYCRSKTSVRSICHVCVVAPLALDIRQRLLTEHRVHIAKAKTFFKLLKNPKTNTAYFSFDCQKNVALPRLPEKILIQ